MIRRQEICSKANPGRGYRIVNSIDGEGSVDKDGGERLATSASGDSSLGCDSLHGVYNTCIVGRKERRHAVVVLYSPVVNCPYPNAVLMFPKSHRPYKIKNQRIPLLSAQSASNWQQSLQNRGLLHMEITTNSSFYHCFVAAR